MRNLPIAAALVFTALLTQACDDPKAAAGAAGAPLDAVKKQAPKESKISPAEQKVAPGDGSVKPVQIPGDGSVKPVQVPGDGSVKPVEIEAKIAPTAH